MIENNCTENASLKSKKVIGYWFNEKKCLKFGANELSESCRERGLSFVKIDLEHDLDKIGTYSIILHKLTALCAPALAGDLKAKAMLKKIEIFLKQHPNVIMIDPLQSIQKLLLRTDTYNMLMQISKDEDRIFTPNYIVMDKMSLPVSAKMLENNDVTFPVVCKPLYAGGSNEAHQMALIFNKDQLRLCCPPACVVQSFINHNAVLYKIFVIGGRWFVTTRPSLKNFEAGDFEMIMFNSHNVSKPDSCSPLTLLDSEASCPKADLLVLQRIVIKVKEALKSELLGIDVIIDVASGDYGIIDVNPFPSYDSVPDVMEHIADMMKKRLDDGEQFSASPEFLRSIDIEQKYVLQDLDTFAKFQSIVDDGNPLFPDINCQEKAKKNIPDYTD